MRINQRQDARGRGNFEHWLYQAKRAGEERRRLPRLFVRERQGKLAQWFQYWSFSRPEPIPENVLQCCLGERVSTCSILQDVLYPLHGAFPAQLLDAMQADICVGHVLWQSALRGYGLNSDGGYVQDTSDRLYWQRVGESLSEINQDDATPEEV